MTGQVLRAGSGPRHACSFPGSATRGDVWQCFTCARRWTCTYGYEEGMEVIGGAWRRRLWPWPTGPA